MILRESYLKTQNIKVLKESEMKMDELYALIRLLEASLFIEESTLPMGRKTIFLWLGKGGW